MLLEGMGIVYLLKPYFNNALKRLVKTPKLYFCDTGLCAHLAGWLTKDALLNGAMSGAYYENHVVMELVKSYAYAPEQANLFFYRDDHKNEIDLLVESDGVLHPIEIKRSASPDIRDAGRFKLLDKLPLVRGGGGIACMCEEPMPINEIDCLIPGNLL